MYSEHLDIGESIQHEKIAELAEMDRRPWYQKVTTVESESTDKVYLVAKVRVLTKQFHDADTVEDHVTITACSCDDWNYNRANGVKRGERSVSEIEKCKHGIRGFRAERAKNDENQDTLV